MLVKDLMTTGVITVKPETLVSEVAELLHQRHFTGIPVVNADNVVLGTISERDFITADSGLYLPTYIKLLSQMDYVQGGKKTLPHVVNQLVGATAKDIMNQQVPFANPDMTLEQLAELFAVKRMNPIPVTDSNNKLLGIVSRSDLIKLFSPGQIEKVYVPEQRHHRAIDDQAKYVQLDFQSRFAYVAKARANVWLTTGVVLFVIGFVAGIVYVADPNIFTNGSPPTPSSRLVPTP